MPISLSSVSFTYSPELAPILSDVSLSLTDQLIGITGPNGSGKSTLVRLIAGELSPTSGSVIAPLAMRLPQDLLRSAGTVAEILDINHHLEALARIEAGSIDPADFDTVGDEWDCEARALALISATVPSLDLDGVLSRHTDTLSGGERVRLGLARLTMAGAPLALLDEPTNNLDRPSRQALLEELRSIAPQVVVVSHDAELLRQVDTIVEVRQGTATTYGGNWDFYLDQRELTTQAALRGVRDAESGLRSEKKDFVHTQNRANRQASHDKARFTAVKGGPKLSDPTAKRAAQARQAGRVRAAAAKVSEAREKLRAAEDSVRADESITIPIINPGTPAGKTVITLDVDGRELLIGGGQRWRVDGRNGSGKTTLLRRAISPTIGYLDQACDLPETTVFEAVRSSAPHRPPHDTYELLASFRLRGDIVHRPTSTLSGGERFRVALARILLADPPPEAIVFDEPTNNLDRDSVDQFITALDSYRGTIIIVCHDEDVISRLNIDRTLTLGERTTF